MQDKAGKRVEQMISRVRRTFQEMDYAQKRVFEVRTGVPVLAPRERRQVTSAVGPRESGRAQVREQTGRRR